MSLPPSLSSASSSSSNASSTKRKSSLTPQRKHRKLLKDGSGSEVWPEHVEKIFVQGLHKYWESPWATYSRGRSRWRNQFLVDHLQSKGITRSKKQVASHIQVLRNMWKGEAEYHLVAGGEELFQENGLLAPVKIEDQSDTHSLIHFDDSDSLSPSFSPQEIHADFPPSPAQAHGSPLFAAESYSPATSLSFPNYSLTDSPYSPLDDHPLLPSPASSSGSSYASLPPTKAVSIGWSPDHLSVSPLAPVNSTDTTAYLQTSTNPNPYTTRHIPNRILMVRLSAEGMSPFLIKVDALVPPSQYSSGHFPPLMLKIKLGISSVDDRYCSPTLHGFAGTLCLAAVWGSSAKCITRVYLDGVCTSEEASPLQISCIDVGNVIVPLPQSILSSCRWLKHSGSCNVTQQIIVDNEVALCIVYELDRRPTPPYAEFLGYQLVPQGAGSSSTSHLLSQPVVRQRPGATSQLAYALG